jgi:hypothetical protein
VRETDHFIECKVFWYCYGKLNTRLTDRIGAGVLPFATTANSPILMNRGIIFLACVTHDGEYKHEFLLNPMVVSSGKCVPDFGHGKSARVSIRQLCLTTTLGSGLSKSVSFNSPKILKLREHSEDLQLVWSAERHKQYAVPDLVECAQAKIGTVSIRFYICLQSQNKNYAHSIRTGPNHIWLLFTFPLPNFFPAIKLGFPNSFSSSPTLSFLLHHLPHGTSHLP